MAFTITITETKSVTKTVGKDWVKTGQVQKEGHFGEKTYLSDTYDYSPEIQKVVETTTEVLKQTVDDLDLVAVIKAVNGIDAP